MDWRWGIFILTALTALIAGCAEMAADNTVGSQAVAAADPGAPAEADMPATPTASGIPRDAAAALAMQVTTYDDGRSCPANCDSHVVFHNAHNGGPNAYAPAPGQEPLTMRPLEPDPSRKCRRGEACVICFDTPGSSCLVATYRGSGPHRGRFDLTPAFLKEWCARPSLPVALATKCRLHMADAARLAAKTNCIAEPDHPDCSEVMTRARLAKEEDLPRYEQCLRMGQTAYNASVRDPRDQREHDCAYYKNRRHSSGEWILLTPGACHIDYYVGRDGLDCCSADPVQAAIDRIECGIYYR